MIVLIEQMKNLGRFYILHLALKKLIGVKKAESILNWG